MDDEFIHDATYWSARLDNVTNNIAPIREKLNIIPTPDLTLEEKLELKHLLEMYAVYSNLLSEAATKHRRVVPEKPFWKKLFQK